MSKGEQEVPTFVSSCVLTCHIIQLSEIARHPGIKDALQLVDECPPGWSSWRESIEGWIFEKDARKLERLDEGGNDTVARLVRPFVSLRWCATDRWG